MPGFSQGGLGDVSLARTQSEEALLRADTLELERSGTGDDISEVTPRRLNLSPTSPPVSPTLLAGTMPVAAAIDLNTPEAPACPEPVQPLGGGGAEGGLSGQALPPAYPEPAQPLGEGGTQRGLSGQALTPCPAETPADKPLADSGPTPVAPQGAGSGGEGSGTTVNEQALVAGLGSTAPVPEQGVGGSGPTANLRVRSPAVLPEPVPVPTSSQQPALTVRSPGALPKASPTEPPKVVPSPGARTQPSGSSPAPVTANVVDDYDENSIYEDGSYWKRLACSISFSCPLRIDRYVRKMNKKRKPTDVPPEVVKLWGNTAGRNLLASAH